MVEVVPDLFHLRCTQIRGLLWCSLSDSAPVSMDDRIQELIEGFDLPESLTRSSQEGLQGQV